MGEKEKMGCMILHLIPTLTIQPTKGEHSVFWHVYIKCQYPNNFDGKERSRVMREVRLEKCKRHCQYDIDRQGLDLILHTLFSEEFQNTHTYITLTVNEKSKTRKKKNREGSE